MITATVHSLEGVIGRLGLDPLTVNRFMEEWLQTAHEVSFEEATDVACILNKMKCTKYYLAPDPTQEGYQVVLIVRDNRVITILTQLTNSFYGVPEAKTVNGTRMIRTLGGEMYEDSSNWVRQLKKKRQIFDKLYQQNCRKKLAATKRQRQLSTPIKASREVPNPNWKAQKAKQKKTSDDISRFFGIVQSPYEDMIGNV